MVFFFDESRFGTHSKAGHAWFKKGERTPVSVKLGFKNFYLYSGVSPLSGDSFTLLLPAVNTQCMNIYLKELGKYSKNQKIFVIMDGASWHKPKDLQVPDNIKIICLPPYSPELNPVERLWQYIKNKTIKNKVYENIEDLEKTICDFVKNIKPDDIMSICTCIN